MLGQLLGQLVGDEVVGLSQILCIPENCIFALNKKTATIGRGEPSRPILPNL
jgi:hypothetical protein